MVFLHRGYSLVLTTRVLFRHAMFANFEALLLNSVGLMLSFCLLSDCFQNVWQCIFLALDLLQLHQANPSDAIQVCDCFNCLYLSIGYLRRLTNQQPNYKLAWTTLEINPQESLLNSSFCQILRILFSTTRNYFLYLNSNSLSKSFTCHPTKFLLVSSKT